jgi:hypothetical protein
MGSGRASPIIPPPRNSQGLMYSIHPSLFSSTCQCSNTRPYTDTTYSQVIPSFVTISFPSSITTNATSTPMSIPTSSASENSMSAPCLCPSPQDRERYPWDPTLLLFLITFPATTAWSVSFTNKVTATTRSRQVSEVAPLVFTWSLSSLKSFQINLNAAVSLLLRLLLEDNAEGDIFKIKIYQFRLFLLLF